MNPHFVRIALGIAAILMARTRLLKSLAVGFAHYSVQGFLIALAGDAPATGAQRLPLALQVVFFPITMLPERYGILIPYGPLLNSCFVGLVFLVILRVLDRGMRKTDEQDAAPPSTTFFQDAFNAVLDVALRRFVKRVQKRGELPESWRQLVNNVANGSVKVGDAKRSVVNWMQSLQAGTTEIQSTQDGRRYWVSAGNTPWGLWMITVATRGLFGAKRTVYTLCLVTPGSAEKFGDPPLKAGLDAGRVKFMTIPQFTEEDGKALQHFVANIAQTAPRAQWQSLIARELHTRFNQIAPANHN